MEIKGNVVVGKNVTLGGDFLNQFQKRILYTSVFMCSKITENI